MRPTNFCHLNDTAFTRTSCVPGSLRGFRRVHVPWSLGLHATLPGDRVLHGTRERFGGPQMDTHCLASRIPRVLLERGSSRAWVCYPHGAHCDRASDTSVASSYVPPDRRCAFALPYLAPPDALSSDGAVLREEAAKVAVTTLS